MGAEIVTTPIKQTAPISVQKKRLHVRYSNRTKCLLCYLLCFALPLLWQLAALWLLYPYKLANTAPNVAQNLATAFPFLQTLLADVTQRAALPADPATLAATLAYRDLVWCVCVGGCAIAAWALTLLTQLGWRVSHANPIFASRATQRAVHTYRLSQLFILAINLLFAGIVWLLGTRFIEGRTVWDYLVYFLVFVLNALAAICCFRLASPPVISGKHAFFKRL